MIDSSDASAVQLPWPAPMRSVALEVNPSSDRAATPQISSFQPLMYAWTFHQSHDQATVLFLVPQTVSSRDLDITIGNDYIVAAVRAQPAIIKARLYGQVNIATSTWRIGDKNGARSRRRSRSLRRPAPRVQSTGTQSSAGSVAHHEHASTDSSDGRRDRFSPAARQGHVPLQASSHGTQSPAFQPDPPLARSDGTELSPLAGSPLRDFSSLTDSTSSLRSGSSYEVLHAGNRPPPQGEARPGAGPAARQSPSTGWSSGSSDIGSQGSSVDMLTMSIVLSEPDTRSESVQAHRIPRRVRSSVDVSKPSSATDSDMVSSVASLGTDRSATSDPLLSDNGEISSAGANDTNSNRSSNSPSGATTEASMITEFEDAKDAASDRPPAVRLVTIHLDKIDTGIWPLLVVGPAPLHVDGADSVNRRPISATARSNQQGVVHESIIASKARRAAQHRFKQSERSNAEEALAKALSEALGSASSDPRELGSLGSSRASVQAYLDNLAVGLDDPAEDMDHPGPSASTLSVVSTASDESATVLGSRTGGFEDFASTEGSSDAGATSPAVSEEEEAERLRELEREARFNMDPTTLSLMGLQVASSSERTAIATAVAPPSTVHAAGALPEAFEYFARAWRVGEIALATERLVQDYLPPLGHPTVLVDSTPPGVASPTPGKAVEMVPQSSADTCRPGRERADNAAPVSARPLSLGGKPRVDAQRQRLVASLGGTKALARLYLSYARLHIPSSAKMRSPLAFPLGQLTSPFVAGSAAHRDSPAVRRKRSSVAPSSPASSRASSAARPHPGPSRSGGASAEHCASPLPSPPNMPLQGHAHSEGAQDDDVQFLVARKATAAVMPGPLHFLEEAIRLDESIKHQILESEWDEATEMEEEERRRKSFERHGIEQAEEMGSLAGESNGGDLVFDSDSEPAPDRRGRPPARRSDAAGRKKDGARRRHRTSDGVAGLFAGLGWMLSGDGGARSNHQDDRSSKSLASSMGEASHPGSERRKRKKDGGRSGTHRRSRGKAASADEEGGVLNFVSGAALLSVAVAGGVAAVGWWRRASGGLSSST